MKELVLGGNPSKKHAEKNFLAAHRWGYPTKAPLTQGEPPTNDKNMGGTTTTRQDACKDSTIQKVLESPAAACRNTAPLLKKGHQTTHQSKEATHAIKGEAKRPDRTAKPIIRIIEGKATVVITTTEHCMIKDSKAAL